MSSPTSALLPAFHCLTEPALLFHPDRAGDTDVHPLRGLRQFGPYSRSHNFKLRDPIHVAVLCPSETLGKVVHLFSELRAVQRPRERMQYLLDFDGFSKVFGIGVDCPSVAQDERVCEVQVRELESALKLPESQQQVAELVLSGVRRLASKSHLFDVLVVYLPVTCSPNPDPGL